MAALLGSLIFVNFILVSNYSILDYDDKCFEKYLFLITAVRQTASH